MFEKAARLQLRFDSAQGNLTVEDLWDLPLTLRANGNRANRACLDDIAKALNKQIKETDTESFVVKAPKVDTITQLKFEIVKHIIDVKLAEAEVAAAKQEAKEKKDKILAIIARKQDEKLEGASLEDLQAMVATL